jgi:hypothetical protein
MMIEHETLLVTLVTLVGRLPLAPSPARRGRGRPPTYPDHLFLGHVSDLYFHSNVCHADPVSSKGVLWYSFLCDVPTVRASR